MPTSDDLGALYPAAAKAKGVDGHTTMQCKVTKDGHLADCVITEETPPSYGFGAAALGSAKFFKMSPTTADGRSVEGGTVVIPMGWRLG